ncbi:MAG TPA: cell division protein FtsL [Clostridia bacterium]|nr:cell division protein FtsL [Clostridia bacterium]
MSVGAIATPSGRAQQNRFWFASVEERFFAAPQPARKPVLGTPEIFFTKPIDNSRLVKVADPRRRRDMTLFTVALSILFVLVMVYLWQHFSAIEYGYKIEALKQQRDAIVETNRALRLEEASLKNPERIDALARNMGLQLPLAGQVQQMDAEMEVGAPVMARAAGVSVVSLTQ